MKPILDFNTKADLDAWADFFMVVTGIPADPETKLARVVVIDGPFIQAESQKVQINAVVYLLDKAGNPINGRIDTKSNIMPRQITLTADNSSFVRLGDFKTVDKEEAKNLRHGQDYLEEFEAYRQFAKGNDINIFTLMENSVRQSKKI